MRRGRNGGKKRLFSLTSTWITHTVAMATLTAAPLCVSFSSGRCLATRGGQEGGNRGETWGCFPVQGSWKRRWRVSVYLTTSTKHWWTTDEPCYSHTLMLKANMLPHHVRCSVNGASYSPVLTHKRVGGGGSSGAAARSNLGLSVLPGETSTCEVRDWTCNL